MNSNIICTTFDFDEWPSVSNNTDKIFGAYNHSIFDLRKKFKYVYPQMLPEEERIDENGDPIEVYGGFFSFFNKVKSAPMDL